MLRAYITNWDTTFLMVYSSCCNVVQKMGHLIATDLQVEEIRCMIDNIAEDVKKVKAKHGEILADPNTDDSESIEFNTAL